MIVVDSLGSLKDRNLFVAELLLMLKFSLNMSTYILFSKLFLFP